MNRWHLKNVANPIGTKDSTMCYWHNRGQRTNGVVRAQNEETGRVVVAQDEAPPIEHAVVATWSINTLQLNLEEVIEISLNYICKYERCDQIKVFVDNKSYFAVIILDKDTEPLNVDEFSHRTYWP